MRAVVVAGVLAACGSSKTTTPTIDATIDAPSGAPRQQIAALDDSQIMALVLSAYGKEVLTLRNLEHFASQTTRADGCSGIAMTGNVVTIAAPSGSCMRTNPPAVNYSQIIVTGSATITNSHQWPGATADASASTVYASTGLQFAAFHVYQTFFGGADGSLEVSPTGLWTGDISYDASSGSQPPPLAIHVQWTCDPAMATCDVGGTELVWNGSGSIAVTGTLQFGTSEHGDLVLQGADRLDATWSGAANQPLSWTIAGTSRAGSLYLSQSPGVGYDWSN